MTLAPDQLASFAFLDGRIRSAVELAASEDPNPADPLRGLYISDEQALSMAARAEGGAIDERLHLAAERLGLDALDAAVLGLCAAPELEPRYGRLYAYLHDDVTRRLASPRLAAELLVSDGVPPETVLASFGPASRLRGVGALRLLDTDAQATLADRPVKVADRLVAFLLGAGAGFGETGEAGRLRRPVTEPSLTGRPDAVAEVTRLLAADTQFPIVVCGPDAAGVVEAVVGRPLLLIGARDLSDPAIVSDALLACALEDRRLCIDGLSGMEPAERARLLRAIDEHREQLIFLAPSRAAALAVSDRPILLVEVPMPSFAERRAAWTAHAGVEEVRDVAAKFRLSIDQIHAAAEVARVTARARGSASPEGPDLDTGARHASSSRVGELARRLPPAYRWHDLVLPERQVTLLHSISAYLRHRDRVLSDWGYEKTVARTQGLKILFAGESGTGKTMAAQVLAAELGLEIFRVDLATIVSKYIGETEKNLDKVFEAADGSNAILFFDEADALFGKRSEVSDSHDRYANLEVAYLLQKMEGYEGAVILCTNFRRNIDDAFVRRLDFAIDFPFPEAEDRVRIWRLLLPDEAPLDDDVDVEFLATQFKLSGGAIRNCSLSAAFQAADEGSDIAMRHLVRAVAQEYGKQGRLTLGADFERFAEDVRRAAGGGDAAL